MEQERCPICRNDVGVVYAFGISYYETHESNGRNLCGKSGTVVGAKTSLHLQVTTISGKRPSAP